MIKFIKTGRDAPWRIARSSLVVLIIISAMFLFALNLSTAADRFLA